MTMVQYDEKELEANWLHLDEDKILDEDEMPTETDEDLWDDDFDDDDDDDDDDHSEEDN